MSLNVSLESERLVYKPLDTSFCTDVYLNWLNDPEVIRYLEIFEPYSMEQLYGFLKQVEQNAQLMFWAIIVKETGKHIGNIKIDPVSRRHGIGEYGIMMGDRAEWGKGYAAEASRTILKYCFEQQQLRKVCLGVVADNQPAVSLYRKLGFITEGQYKDHCMFEGKICDVYRMAFFQDKANQL